MIINAWSKGSEHIPAWMVVNCVNNIVKKTSVLTVLPNEELLSFFITFIDKEWFVILGHVVSTLKYNLKSFNLALYIVDVSFT